MTKQGHELLVSTTATRHVTQSSKSGSNLTVVDRVSKSRHVGTVTLAHCGQTFPRWSSTPRDRQKGAPVPMMSWSSSQMVHTHGKSWWEASLPCGNDSSESARSPFSRSIETNHFKWRVSSPKDDWMRCHAGGPHATVHMPPPRLWGTGHAPLIWSSFLKHFRAFLSTYSPISRFMILKAICSTCNLSRPSSGDTQISLVRHRQMHRQRAQRNTRAVIHLLSDLLRNSGTISPELI